MELVELLQLCITFFMLGLIWLVQLVHYPLMAAVGRSHFVEYEAQHQRRISWIVVPVMLAELSLAVVSVLTPPPGDQMFMIIGLVLLTLIWLSTALLQVPSHRQLSVEYSDKYHRRLVQTNWFRTYGWSMRAAILFAAALT